MSIIISLIVSGVFVLIGLITTERTAPYLLSGYNMLSAEARKEVDLKGYIAYFRKFFVGLGITNFIFCAVLFWTGFKLASGLTLIFYPLVAIMYFTVTSLKFIKGKMRTLTWAGMIVLAGAIGISGFSINRTLAENEIIVMDDTLEIQGKYGEVIAGNDIKSIRLVESLPDISMRTNGFSLGDARKGYFKTTDGETIKLLLTSSDSPFILIEKKSGQQIFYSVSTERNKQLFNTLIAKYPHLAQGKEYRRSITGAQFHPQTQGPKETLRLEEV